MASLRVYAWPQVTQLESQVNKDLKPSLPNLKATFSPSCLSFHPITFPSPTISASLLLSLWNTERIICYIYGCIQLASYQSLTFRYTSMVGSHRLCAAPAWRCW